MIGCWMMKIVVLEMQSSCTAPESNKRWAKALDKLKTIEFESDEDNIHEIFEVSMLHLSGGKGYFQ